MAETSNKDDLVAKLNEISRRFSDIVGRKKSKDDELPDREWQDQKTRDKIECWTDALKLVTYELRDERGAPSEITVMLRDLVGELANIYSGQESSLRALLLAAKRPPQSIQRSNAQALVTIIFDNMRETGLSKEVAARKVSKKILDLGLEVHNTRSDKKTENNWQSIIDLRKKVRSKKSSKHPLKKAYDSQEIRLRRLSPTERINEAWRVLRELKVD